MSADKIDATLASLDDMSLSELRQQWIAVSTNPIPRISAALLRLAIAWELQAAVLGGHSRATLQTLDQLAAGQTKTRCVQAGMRLLREWNGKVHVVIIDENDAIRWNDQTWKSLSAVARAITGTRWSGPAFFGLKRRKKAA